MSSAESSVWSAILQAFQKQRIALMLVVSIVFLLGAIILLIYFTTDVNVRIILSDPAETALLPEYAGFYSNLGVLVLWTSAVIGAVSAWRGRFPSSEEKRFLWSYVAIIGFLSLDDLFMLHEWMGLILARMTNAEDIGSARSALEAYVFAVYVVIIFIWLWINRIRVWNSPWPLLVLGGFGFAISIGLDLAPYLLTSLEDAPLRVQTTLAVAEDLAKLLGIGGLAAYGMLVARDPLFAATARAGDGDS